jgi:hypothetical protein
MNVYAMTPCSHFAILCGLSQEHQTGPNPSRVCFGLRTGPCSQDGRHTNDLFASHSRYVAAAIRQCVCLPCDAALGWNWASETMVSVATALPVVLIRCDWSFAAGSALLNAMADAANCSPD